MTIIFSFCIFVTENLLLQAFFPTFAVVIEIDRHIEILLLSNDCVIVPGLGGFMAHHVDARKDERDGSILPPMRAIGFNPKLNLNDSLLAQSYVEAYDLSYPDAVKRIEDEVRELWQHLEKKGRFELNDIGIISINDEGNLEFEPCIAGLLTPSLYGLSNFDMLTLDELTRQISAQGNTASARLVSIAHALPAMSEEEGAEADITPAASSVAAGASTVACAPTAAGSAAGVGSAAGAPSTNDSELSASEPYDDEADEPAHNARLVALWRNLAVACIAVLAFLLVPTPLTNSGSNLLESRIDTGLLQRVMPKDQVAPAAAPSTLHVAVTASTAKAPGTADAITVDHSQPRTVVPAVRHGFCIVLASRVTKKNARLYAADLHERGYSAARVLDRVKGAKVVYGDYKTQADAQHDLNQLTDKEEFASAWVMKY